MFTDSTGSSESLGADLKIKIIGVGGGGTNVVDGLKLDNLEGDVSLAAINTDAQALANSPLTEKLVIGRSVTRGLGTGGDLEIGHRAAESDREAIGEMIAGVDLLLLVVGLGGGTGSAVAPLIAEVAAQSDAVVIAFATLPFTFQGARPQRIAEDSMAELRSRVHGLVPLPNDMLLQEAEEGASVLNAFSVADQWIARGVNALCSMLLKTGLINQDFGSMRSVFRNIGGKTFFGTGSAAGEGYVEAALESLLTCPLLHMGDRPKELDRILVNVIGGADLQITQINHVMSQVSNSFDSREDVVFGAVIDENRHQSLEISILAKSDLELVSALELEAEPDPQVAAAPEGIDPTSALEALGLQAEIAKDNRPPRVVHQSKLRKQKKDAVGQDEFNFIDSEAQRGYFEKSDRNLYNEEDLDVPTYLRRGIKIKIKV